MSSALDAFGAATRAWFQTTFHEPTRVQESGWPQILAGHHTVLLAPTGSGKTLAAFLAGLDHATRLPADAPEGVRVLYVSPLKALVYDIERNLRSPLVGIRRAGERLGIPLRAVGVDIRTGDTPQRDRQRQSRRPQDILVTTPESLYLLLTSKARETLRTVQVVIIDEIHVMVGTKRGVHLALSLERLSALAHTDPQRIGLSATQRPLDLVARYLGGDRPVEVVDTSEPPHISLEIVVPVRDMERPDADLPALPVFEASSGGAPVEARISPAASGNSPGMKAGIWPSIHPRLLALIQQHRSTIVFVNSRVLCERLAAALNELAGKALVHAHHGSISHSQRAQIEEDLKRGRVPGIIATSSLELGIDMGAVDLVILVESPGSVGRGLQRIGRAGHQVGAVSQGRIFPKFRGDLLECAVVSGRMAQGAIEATSMPRNCLDVLAQQIVAMVAMEDRSLPELEALVRRAAPYRDLSHDLMAAVLDMLAGRYPSDGFADLTPRITWDRARDTLKARRGARMLAVLNPGTIPDRGLYRVHLGEGGPRLGELDEEMVFESRNGDTIILGASTWRITEITRDKVLVEPATGEPGRLPFWHGERPGRPLELGRAMGAFLREIEPMDEPTAAAWLGEQAPLDAWAANNLAAYVAEQKAITGGLPTDRQITVERFRDELGDWRVCILTPFGARVHAPWALALEAVLSAEHGFDVKAFSSDDGIVLRMADTEELPDVDSLFPDPDDLEDLLVAQLQHSALFAARFREAAARALLLPRRQATARSPLWLQRRRSQDLQATAVQFPGFPIVLETYRECLQDVFDLTALSELLRAIRRREVGVTEVETRTASPFARSLVFQYIAAYLYDGDAPLAERKSLALTLDRNLLRELLGQEQLRELLDPIALDEVEAELQWLADDRHARHADAAHDLLRRLGDLSTAEIAARCTEDPLPWLARLADERRAIEVRIAGEPRWIASEDATRYRDALGISLPPGLPAAFMASVEAPLESLIQRWARTHGPFHTEAVAGRFGVLPAATEAVLRGLELQGTLLRGEMRPGGVRREWCDPGVLRRLRRRSLAKLREEIAPVEPEVLARFLVSWHGLGTDRGGYTRLQEAVAQLEGVPLPFSELESRLLPDRVRGFNSELLDRMGAMGEVVWVGRGALGTRDGRVALYRRDRVPELVDPPVPLEEPSPIHTAILDHLTERGASFLVELQHAAGEPPLKELVAALWDLVWGGLVTNDTFQPLRGLSATTRTGGRRSRRIQTVGGRWSVVSRLIGVGSSGTERAFARANLLLERYGVVGRQTASVEELPGGFTAVYPVLRAMEESGRIRRGYFVDGLGGAQFALPGAVDRLRGARPEHEDVSLVAATDPANAWGALLPWPATHDPASRIRREPGARVVLVGGVPALWLGRGARRMVVFSRAVSEPDRLEKAVEAIRGSLGFKSLRIDTVDSLPALESPHLEALLSAGCSRDYKGLVLVR